ncbi:MAG: hypothetical protein FWG90_09795 [Oscillospiraceae bacterium]|nr:hypothetical protein [Oscillospiraceae bacterium]
MTASLQNLVKQITATFWTKGGYFFSFISYISLITLQVVLMISRIRTNVSINYHLLSELEEKEPPPYKYAPYILRLYVGYVT